MRTIAALLLSSLAFVGCGNGSQAGPLCSDFVGSCNASGSSCVEYGGGLDVPATQAACTQGGTATWSTAACPSANAVGACIFDAGGVCSAQYYYQPYPAADAQAACTASGGVFDDLK